MANFDGMNKQLSYLLSLDSIFGFKKSDIILLLQLSHKTDVIEKIVNMLLLWFFTMFLLLHTSHKKVVIVK